MGSVRDGHWLDAEDRRRIMTGPMVDKFPMAYHGQPDAVWRKVAQWRANAENAKLRRCRIVNVRFK